MIHPNLIDIAQQDPSIALDIRYATSNNIVGKPLYRQAICYMHRDTATALMRVQTMLRQQQLGLKIFDAYRPAAAQEALWQAVPDPRYVSNPQQGGRHSRGTAVDVTLINAQGQELPMPSGFDEMNRKAHRDYQEATAAALRHRDQLEQAMQQHGFVPFATEWWHFDLQGWEDYPPIDVAGLAVP
ncbi:MAG: D-alanyl-D-alanine dipeptidase [Myxococcota bacterium]